MRAICGGIDLGGTKIEARLFGDGMEVLQTRRVPTPAEDFERFADALAGEIRWLGETAGDPALPVGVALPGTVDPRTGRVFAANIPVSGHDLPAALHARLGRAVLLGNDAMAFAVSEAEGASGESFACVAGLILGTGVSAGLCIHGAVPPRLNGMAVEIGHAGMPARALHRHGLPLFQCPCGALACVERYVSGPGLSTLCETLLGERLAPAAIAARGDAAAERVLAVWSDLAAECLLTLQLTLDPDCIVLGGGLSRMPGLVERLAPALDARLLGNTRAPALRLARHGDSSGARGIALLALREGGQ